MNTKNLSSYITEVSRSEPRYKDLDKVVLAIAAGAIEIQHIIKTASLSYAIGDPGAIDVQAESLQQLDTVTSDTFVRRMTQCGHVAAIGCEEINQIVAVAPPKKNSYIVQMDPLDGDYNIEVAINVGSIFGIWPNNSEDSEPKILYPGNAQVAALYTLYGTSTTLVIALENSVQGFTLNPANSKFELSHPDIQIPDKACCYSINEGNFYRFDSSTKSAVARLRHHYSLRYVGSLTADFHRNLLKGGIFLYPKDSSHPNGKLRLMYQANPLSFIIEQAGGIASSGEQRILDIEPCSLHQRTPLVTGNRALVYETLECINEH